MRPAVICSSVARTRGRTRPDAVLAATETGLEHEERAKGRSAPRTADAKRGPFSKLIIRGTTLIDGSGAPPRGPVDIVIEGNRITDIVSVGYPHTPIDTAKRPRGPARELDGAGLYVLPGLVDVHVHQGTQQKAPDSEYYNKLWLAHGITTVRGVPFASFDYLVKEKARSGKNEITAPRYFVYQRPVTGGRGGTNPEQARAGAVDRPERRGRPQDRRGAA